MPTYEFWHHDDHNDDIKEFTVSLERWGNKANEIKSTHFAFTMRGGYFLLFSH